MHPEVRQEGPGKCPKCGMPLSRRSLGEGGALMPEQNKPAPRIHTEDRGLGALSWRNYIPLFVIIALILASAIVASWGNLITENLITKFMIGFFLVFGGFKLLDLRGFAHGYSTYDLLAQRWMGYGYTYPFIELAFGLSMLAGFMPLWLLWVEFAVMLFSGIGVVIKLAKKEQFQCVCLGTFLKVPLTKVTLVEDFGMAALALLLIFIQ